MWRIASALEQINRLNNGVCENVPSLNDLQESA